MNSKRFGLQCFVLSILVTTTASYCMQGPLNTIIETVQDIDDTLQGPFGIAITPNGLYAYVANGTGNSVSVLQLSSNTVVGTVVDPLNTFNNPAQVAITPDGLYAYVSNQSGNSVSVIQLSSNSVIATVADPLHTFNKPEGIGITADGSTGYVANGHGGTYGAGSVSVIQLSNNSVIETVADPMRTFSASADIAIANGYAYVTNLLGNSVSVIQLSSNSVIETVADPLHTFKNPSGIAITPDNNYAYVANPNLYGAGGNSSVSVIQLSNNSVIETVADPLQTFTGSINIAIANGYAYVINALGGTVSVIQLSSNSVIEAVANKPMGIYYLPIDIAITPNGSTGYITSGEMGTVTVFTRSAPTPATIGQKVCIILSIVDGIDACCNDSSTRIDDLQNSVSIIESQVTDILSLINILIMRTDVSMCS